jgi:ABC-2 type transport system permease protein
MSITSPIPTSSIAARPPSTRSRFSAALHAFLAIMERDLVVTMRQFVSFLVQVLLQPIFLLFIFGRILPSIGATQNSYAAIFLPGVVALTMFMTGVQGP